MVIYLMKLVTFLSVFNLHVGVCYMYEESVAI